VTELRDLTPDLEALADLENYPQWIVDEIKPYLGARLAEIGAGIGTITKRIADGHLQHLPEARLEAFEPAGNLYRRLQEQLNHSYPELVGNGRLVATRGYFESSPERYDTVIMINVLEHIEEDQATLQQVFRSLTPDGRVVVFVPALSWLYSPYDKAVGHYRRYEKEQLEGLFKKSGFELLKAKYLDCLGMLPWYLFYVLGRSQSMNRDLAQLYDRWVVPVTRWIEERHPPVLGKNILIVGRKIPSE
jgi:SAM-dependent methyltransferase